MAAATVQMVMTAHQSECQHRGDQVIKVTGRKRNEVDDGMAPLSRTALKFAYFLLSLKAKPDNANPAR